MVRFTKKIFKWLKFLAIRMIPIFITCKNNFPFVLICFDKPFLVLNKLPLCALKQWTHEAMNTQQVYKSMVCEVHNLLRLYLTISITSATTERSFSALQNVITYLSSSMTEQRLNNCMLLHIHKQLTDFIQIAKEFIAINAERKLYFGTFTNI